MMTIKIGKIMGSITEYVFEAGTTVSQALEIAGLTDVNGYAIKLDGEDVQLDTVIDGGEYLLLSRLIKGN